MNRFISLLVYLWPLLLAADIPYQEAPEVASTEGLPSSLVNGTVSVISGEYVDSVVDIVIPGPEPLMIARHYSSLSLNGWSFNHLDCIALCQAFYQENDYPSLFIDYRQPSGTQFNYIYSRAKHVKDHKSVEFRLIKPAGLTNGAEVLSGRTNIKNQVVRYYEAEGKIEAKSSRGDLSTFYKIGTADGGAKKFLQKEMERLNGSRYVYENAKTNWNILPWIICKSNITDQLYSQVVPKSDDGKTLTLTTSDGRSLVYHQHKHKFNEKTHEWQFGLGMMPDGETIVRYISGVKNPYSPEEN